MQTQSNPWIQKNKHKKGAISPLFDIIIPMDKKKIDKLYKEIKSLAPESLSEVRDKLIPLFLDLEKVDPFKDKKVINLLKKRYAIGIKEYKEKKLIDAEAYLRKSLG